MGDIKPGTVHEAPEAETVRLFSCGKTGVTASHVAMVIDEGLEGEIKIVFEMGMIQRMRDQMDYLIDKYKSSISRN